MTASYDVKAGLEVALRKKEVFLCIYMANFFDNIPICSIICPTEYKRIDRATIAYIDITLDATKYRRRKQAVTVVARVVHRTG